MLLGHASVPSTILAWASLPFLAYASIRASKILAIKSRLISFWATLSLKERFSPNATCTRFQSLCQWWLVWILLRVTRQSNKNSWIPEMDFLKRIDSAFHKCIFMFRRSVGNHHVLSITVQHLEKLIINNKWAWCGSHCFTVRSFLLLFSRHLSFLSFLFPPSFFVIAHQLVILLLLLSDDRPCACIHRLLLAVLTCVSILALLHSNGFAESVTLASSFMEHFSILVQSRRNIVSDIIFLI